MFLFWHWRMNIKPHIVWCRKVIKEIKWDLYEAKQYGCTPTSSWYHRIK